MTEQPVAALQKPSRTEAKRTAIYRFLDTCMSEINRLGGLPTPREAREMWGDIWLLETHHSTGIEGNTLTFTEVARLLRDKQPVEPQQLHDYLEIRGYAHAAQWAYTQALEPDDWTANELLSLREIRHVHHEALTPVWEQYPHADATFNEYPGSFRQHDIKPFSGGMEPPNWTEVPNQLRTWIDKVNRIAEDCDDTLTRIAERHAEFERIHPFLDGNGRTGRLLLNLLLVRLKYPPAIILRQRRKMYLAALKACDHGDPGPLCETIASAVITTLKTTIFPCITGPGRYVLLSVLADGEFSSSRLSEAARRGKLQAQKDEDGFWRSTPRLVEEYKASCRRRRVGGGN